MEDMKENIKIGLLGVIAVTLIINTFFNDSKSVSSKDNHDHASQPASNLAATPAAPIQADLNSFNQTNNPAPAVEGPKGPTTTMSFSSMEHDFGTVKQNTENKYNFKFTNTGKEPLIIESAMGSCGCTVPNYPKEPIAPGKSANIEVVYSPGTQQGNQAKTVTIKANTDPYETKLQIKANVITE